MAYSPVPKLTNSNATFNYDLAVSGILTAGSGVVLVDLVPSSTTNALYNDGGTLKFNGAAIGGGGGGTADLQTVTDNGATTTNAVTINNTLEAETVLADFDGPVILPCKNTTGSQIDAGTAVYVSGYFSSNGKALIAPAVGNDPTKMPSIGLIADDLAHDTEGHVHVFGLAAGFNTSSFTVGETVYVAPTGGITNVRPTGVDELVQNMGRVLRSDATQGRVLLLGPGRTNDVPNSGNFEILRAATSNFEHINLTSDDELPTFTFTGSGVNDTPVTMEVRSSFQSATGSGTALLFQGTQGQLFSITDNLSSGTIFNVSDITGLPMLEVTASGDVEIGEFADNVTIHQPVRISGGVPADTTDKLYNNAGELYFNGASLGYDDTYVSGIATYASGQAIQNESDILSASGYFENEILELIGVSGIEISSVGSTVYLNNSYVSGVASYASGQAISNQADIVTVSGLIPSPQTAGSGLTLVSDEYNIYGGTGNFQQIDLTSDNYFVPNMLFTGSGVNDTPIRLKVLSSHASASTSGTALSFEGTQGQLFGVTDNLSSGTIFSVNDITGLPMLEVDASGDVKVGRFANSVVLYSPSVNGSVQGDLNVTGAFSAITKSFLIDHPSKEGMRLQYASLEGPENGVYVRGTTDEGFITLPDYWRDLVHNSSITVTLTPVGQFQPLFVEQKNNREIRVGGVCGYYDYVVYGERKDVDKLEVEW